MTKLMEWLVGGCLFLSLWLALLNNIFQSSLINDWMHVVVAMPVIAVGFFGVYAASVVFWRVYTFNDCENAAKELQQQIIEAREDLQRHGFIFQASDKKTD